MLFALAGGLTLSGIVANVYRLLAGKPEGQPAAWVYYGVMLFAGPSVLFENSTRSFRKKECSGAAYGFALGAGGLLVALHARAGDDRSLGARH